VYDEDESELEDAVANSDAVAEHVFSTWLANLKSAELELDDEAKFIEGQLKAILLAFGKKRPKVRDYSLSFFLPTTMTLTQPRIS